MSEVGAAVGAAENADVANVKSSATSTDTTIVLPSATTPEMFFPTSSPLRR